MQRASRRGRAVESRIAVQLAGCEELDLGPAHIRCRGKDQVGAEAAIGTAQDRDVAMDRQYIGLHLPAVFNVKGGRAKRNVGHGDQTTLRTAYRAITSRDILRLAIAEQFQPRRPRLQEARVFAAADLHAPAAAFSGKGDVCAGRQPPQNHAGLGFGWLKSQNRQAQRGKDKAKAAARGHSTATTATDLDGRSNTSLPPSFVPE